MSTQPNALVNASTSPYFGRAWNVTIQKAGVDGKPTGQLYVVSNSDWDTEALRIEFSIEQMTNGSDGYWYADIVVWNLSNEYMQIFKKNDFVTVLAGYQKTFSQQTSTIWKGRIFQAIIERENVVDSKLTLHCLIGLLEDESNVVSITEKGNSTGGDAVLDIATAAGMFIDTVDFDALRKVKYPRAQTFQGRASDLLNEIALDSGLLYWLGPAGINMRSMEPQENVPDLVFGPSVPQYTTLPINLPSNYTPTLIGTPQMTEQGVTFRVLLDSRLRLRQLVKIDNSLIRVLKQYIGQNPYLLLNPDGTLDKDQIWVVARINHSGDSRGQTWYSDVTAVARTWAKLNGQGLN